MSSSLKTDYFYEQDDFTEFDGQLRELTVTITLSEYRELVASSVLQRDYIDQIDDLTQVLDSLCKLIFEHAPEFERTIRDAVELKLPPSVFEALFRAAKDGDADV